MKIMSMQPLTKARFCITLHPMPEADPGSQPEDIHIIGGFSKETLKAHAERFGPAIDDARQLKGYVGLSPAKRTQLGLQVGNIVDITRTGITEVYKATVVPGRDGVVALTGTLRTLLGLDKAQSRDNEQAGDTVTITKVDDKIVLTLTGKGEGTSAEYGQRMA